MGGPFGTSTKLYIADLFIEKNQFLFIILTMVLGTFEYAYIFCT